MPIETFALFTPRNSRINTDSVESCVNPLLKKLEVEL
jgi:hypothetical protein